MKRQVFWSAAALDDFDAVIAHIAAEEPAAARRVAKTIDRAARQLGARAIGRPGRVGSTYEKSVSGLPWIIAYALDDAIGRLIVLRVIHTARDWPKGSWPR